MPYTYTYGAGTELDPYQIWTPEDLNGVRDWLSSYFIQMADVSLSGYANWEPIGGTFNNAFTGNYNGNGFGVTSLTINAPDTSGVGLFGYAYNAFIVALKVEGNVTGDQFVGLLVGFYGTDTQIGSISQCFTTGSVTGDDSVGGLVGRNDWVIQNSFSRATVSGTTKVGGFIGENMGNIYYSYAAGQTSGTTYVGGFCGKDEVYIESCYYDSETSGQSDTGKGEPKTTAEMKTQGTFTGWDFSDVWYISEFVNDGYPYLRSGFIEVWTAEDLDNVRNNLSGNYIQMADIDLSAYANWTPIGDAWSNCFTGAYNGNNFKISNLNAVCASNQKYAGIFGTVDTQESVQNVYMYNSYITDAGTAISNRSVGSLIGHLMNGIVMNCHIDNVNIQITNFGKIGGLIGAVGDSNGDMCNVIKCSASFINILITGTNNNGINAGGLIGELYRGSAEECYSSNGFIDGGTHISGFIYSYIACIGGFAGRIRSSISTSNPTIKNCYSMVDIKTPRTGGGFVGHSDAASSIMLPIHYINCYSKGQVSQYYSYDWLGGFAGVFRLNTNHPFGIADNCYYDSTVSGQTDTGKGEPKTTAEMKTQETFIDWDFNDIWGITLLYNDGYPYFQWEISPITLDQVAKPTWYNYGISWQDVENATNYEVKLYKNAVLASTKTILPGFQFANFGPELVAGGVGSYTATVQAIGDGVNFLDGDVSIESDALTVVKLATVSKPIWDGKVLNWTDVSNAKGFRVVLSSTAGELSVVHINPGIQAYDFSNALLLEEFSGTYGGYTATVQAIGDQVMYLNGDVSTASEAYRIRGPFRLYYATDEDKGYWEQDGTWKFFATPDHGNLEGVGDDDHSQYLNNARHDVAVRHPFSRVSATGGTGGVTAFQMVIATASGTVQAANAAEASHVGKVMGMTLAAIAEAQAGEVQFHGLITNPSWNLTPGDPYYLSSGGNITDTAPVTGFIQRVGVAKSATELILKLSEPILL